MSRETPLPVIAPSSQTAKRRWQTPVVVTATTDVTEKTSNFRDSVATPGGSFYAGPS